MKVIILYPNAAEISALALADVLKCEALNPFEKDRRDFTEYDLVINYGCNRNIKAPAIVNRASSVARCIDKYATFAILSEGDIPVPTFTSDKAIASKWECVVVRKDVKGNQNNGMSYHYPEEFPLPHAPLYVKYFPHYKEYRVVVINGITTFCYEKVRKDGEWGFYLRDYQYLIPIRTACMKAAELLAINYVGFDVLVNENKEFVILEANSAPILTDDSAREIKKLVKRFEKELVNGA